MRRRSRLSFLHISNWPLWRRLLYSFIIAMSLPTLLVYALAAARVSFFSDSVVRDYLTQVGQDQRSRLDRALADARITLRNLAENDLYRQQINAVLADNDPTQIRRANVINVMNSLLVSSRVFESARLLNTRGRSVLHTNQASPQNVDESNFQSFLTGLRATQLGGETELVVYRVAADGDTPGYNVIEIVQLIYSDDRSRVTGYLIGQLNLDQVVLSNITISSDAFIRTRSYLATASNVLIGLPGQDDEIHRSAQQSPIQAALRGQTGVTEYTIDGQRYFAQYIRLAERGLVLITESRDLTRYTLNIADAVSNNLEFVILFAVLAIILTVALNRQITTPLNELGGAMRAMAQGNFTMPVPAADAGDETGLLARAFISMRAQVQDTISALEARVNARTRDILATQEVSRFAATQRDLQVLMDEVVNLIVNEFPNIYHAQIFLVDDDRRFGVLRASTGEPGRKLLAIGHRLAVGSISVIGQVTEQGRPVVVADISTSDVHRRNQYLPETEAELAIPLRVGGRVIGALDVQSRQANTFTEDQVSILQTMADQIAIAIENARLYEESLAQLAEIAASNREKTYLDWQEALYARRANELVARAGLRETGEAPELANLRIQAQGTGQPVVGERTARGTIPLAVPIVLRGQVIGAVAWELPAVDFSHDKIRLAEELVNRLAVNLDNARLLEQSQHGIARERLLNQIAGRLAGQTNIKEILQIAVREVGQALRAPDVNIQLQLRDLKAELPKTNGAKNNTNGSNGMKHDDETN